MNHVVGAINVISTQSHFTCFVEFYATTNKSPQTAVDHLYNNFMLIYGTPGKILADQGKRFEDSLFALISKLCGMKRLEAAQYHPKPKDKLKGWLRI